MVRNLEDLLIVGKRKHEVQVVTHHAMAALRGAEFPIGAKSIFTPVAEARWMGKTVSAQASRMQPRPVAVANRVVECVRMVVVRGTRVSLRRLLGRLVCFGRPGNTEAAL